MTLSDKTKAKIQAEYDSWRDKLWVGKTKEERQMIQTMMLKKKWKRKRIQSGWSSLTGLTATSDCQSDLILV